MKRLARPLHSEPERESPTTGLASFAGRVIGWDVAEPTLPRPRGHRAVRSNLRPGGVGASLRPGAREPPGPAERPAAVVGLGQPASARPQRPRRVALRRTDGPRAALRAGAGAGQPSGSSRDGPGVVAVAVVVRDPGGSRQRAATRPPVHRAHRLPLAVRRGVGERAHVGGLPRGPHRSAGPLPGRGRVPPDGGRLGGHGARGPGWSEGASERGGSLVPPPRDAAADATARHGADPPPPGTGGCRGFGRAAVGPTSRGRGPGEAPRRSPSAHG